MFHEGIETHELDGVQLRIYDPEKTLVDCFRYRNQLGMDVVLDALRLWRERRKKKLDVLLKYARMRHVARSEGSATAPPKLLAPVVLGELRSLK